MDGREGCRFRLAEPSRPCSVFPPLEFESAEKKVQALSKGSTCSCVSI